MSQQKFLIIGFLIGLISLVGVGWLVDFTLAQTADTSPPTFSNVRALNIIGPGAQINWDTSEPAKNPTVVYGTSPGSYPNIATASCVNDANNFFSNHCVNLTSLAYNTLYHYKVKSTDAANNQGESPEFTFTSASAPVPAAPTNLTATVSGSNVTLNWTDNSNDETEFKVYERLSGNATWNLISTVASNTTTFTHSNVSAGTHEYHVNACNSSGCSGDSNIATTTVAATDTTPPSAPSGFTATVVSSTKVDLSWSSSTDNVGVSGYKVYRGDTLWVTITTTGYSDTSVVAGTTYSYKVAAYDAAGNISPFSEIRTVTTSGTTTTATTTTTTTTTATADTSPPTTPTNFVATAFSSTQINLSWSSSTDNVGISGYKVYRNDLLWVTVNATHFEDTAVSAGVIYAYKVAAYDSAGNISPFTPTVSIATSSATTPPLQPAPTTGAPTVTAWGVGVDPGGLATVGIQFSVEMDELTFNDTSFFIQKTSDPPDVASHVSVDFQKIPFGASLTTKSPLISGVEYVSIVKASVKSKAGVFMGLDFICVFNSPAPGNHLTACPRTSTLIQAPPPPPPTTTLSPVSLVEFKPNLNKVITGRVTYPDGSPVFDAQVGIFSYNLGRFVNDVLVDGSGKYTLLAAPGRFGVGARSINPFGSTWTPIFGQDVEFKFDETPETKLINFTVQRADNRVTISVGDDKGVSLSEAGIGLETYRFEFTAAPPSGVHQFKYSDASGRATFFVPPGEYLVRAFLPPDRGYFNPDEQRLRVTTGETVLHLVFKKREAQTSIALRGTVKFDDETPVSGAHIWGWAERGGFADARSNEKGEFSLPVSLGNRWHIGAAKELPTATGYIAFKSSEVIVEVTPTVQPVAVVLTRLAIELPPPVIIKQEFTKSVVAETKDGAQVVIPERAVPVSGNVNVNWTPTVQAPSQEGARVVGTVYDLTIKDDAGQSVSQLDKEIQITIPYNKADLEKEGLSEDKVVPSYFDEKSGAWVKIDDYTIDKENKQVVIRVKHLTRFALVAPADITAPSAPTSFTGQASGATEATLIWVNPKADFHHVKVYRSEKSGEIGGVIDDLVTTETYKDKTVAIGKTYYYSLKSVDASGNESTVTKQIAINVTGKAVPVTKGKFVSALVRGSRGQIVKDLQLLLQKLGFFPATVQATTFFGPVTEKAVKDFQKSKGFEQVGIVGPKTRAELNKLSQ